MPVYLFYPHLANGTALAFEAEELESDSAAFGYAFAVLAEHEAAVSVSTYRGERRLREVRRDELDRVAIDVGGRRTSRPRSGA